MTQLRYTLVADGSSDRTLIPIINWLFDRADILYQPQFAVGLPPASDGLKLRVNTAVKLFPCDLLFVHRDAEKISFSERVSEIQEQLKDINKNFLPIVPVRMTEAWLLSSEAAIRMAAGNPNGTIPLDLPPCREWENKPNPKEILFKALRDASNLQGRRLRGFSEEKARHRVSELTEDFAHLEHLEAFARLRDDVDAFINTWKQRPICD